MRKTKTLADVQGKLVANYLKQPRPKALYIEPEPERDGTEADIYLNLRLREAAVLLAALFVVLLFIIL